MKIVLQKFIVESGYCSRRKAGELIKEGKVFVNEKVAELGMKVSEEDKVKISGNEIRPLKEKIYIKLNKPAGYTCTARKFSGEKNIFSLVDIKERLFVVGRLDKNSRGLILLTNDGDLTQKITHPSFKHKKEYIVKIKNDNISQKIKKDDLIKVFKQGVDIGEGDGVVKAHDIFYIEGNKFKIILTEGKKRQIRRMFETVDIKVEDLLRVSIGKLKLGSLPEGEWQLIDKKEVSLD